MGNSASLATMPHRCGIVVARWRAWGAPRDLPRQEMLQFYHMCRIRCLIVLIALTHSLADSPEPDARNDADRSWVNLAAASAGGRAQTLIDEPPRFSILHAIDGLEAVGSGAAGWYVPRSDLLVFTWPGRDG
jgi:hypothetical protein